MKTAANGKTCKFISDIILWFTILNIEDSTKYCRTIKRMMTNNNKIFFKKDAKMMKVPIVTADIEYFLENIPSNFQIFDLSELIINV